MTSPRSASKGKFTGKPLGVILSVVVAIVVIMLSMGFGVQMQAQHHIVSASAHNTAQNA